MGSQVRILSIRLAWEYRFPWISPGREDARAVRPAAPAGGINTSVTTGKKGRRALANAGIQAPSGVQAPDVHSEASHPSFGWRTIRHRRATYPKKSTAMRMWCSGSTPASQAGNRGFDSRTPLDTIPCPLGVPGGEAMTMRLVSDDPRLRLFDGHADIAGAHHSRMMRTALRRKGRRESDLPIRQVRTGFPES